jgi:hypothetical protein
MGAVEMRLDMTRRACSSAVSCVTSCQVVGPYHSTRLGPVSHQSPTSAVSIGSTSVAVSGTHGAPEEIVARRHATGAVGPTAQMPDIIVWSPTTAAQVHPSGLVVRMLVTGSRQTTAMRRSNGAANSASCSGPQWSPASLVTRFVAGLHRLALSAER